MARVITAAWRRLALDNAPSARSSHGLSVIAGKAYLFGGEAKARHAFDSVMHILDLTTNTPSWQQVGPHALQAPPPRVAHAQAAVNNKILIFGGRSGVEMGGEHELNDLWEFDPSKNTWTHLENRMNEPPAPSARSFHAATSVGDKMYVFGGCGVDGRLADLHEYCTTARRWTVLPSPPEDVKGRGGAALEASSDGSSLWLVGGFAGHETNDLLRFCLRNRSWERKPSDGWLRPRSVCASFSTSRALAVFGGEVSPSDRGHEGAGGFAADLVAFDPHDGAPLDVRVTATDGAASRPPARGWAASATLSDREGLVIGGLSGTDAEPVRLDDAWVLELSE